MWKHKQKCKSEEIHESGQDNMMLSLILEVVKSNGDFKNLLVEKTKQEESLLDSTLVVQLIKQNDEFKNLLVEQNKQMMQTFQETFQDTFQEVCKNGINNITNSNNINSNNIFFSMIASSIYQPNRIYIRSIRLRRILIWDSLCLFIPIITTCMSCTHSNS
jgi:hypothetical protein